MTTEPTVNTTVIASTSPSHVIIFDFDYSLINVNSDTYVPEKLAPILEEFIKNEIKKGTQWTALMDMVVKKLYHEHHITPDQINTCLASMPYFPEIGDILRYAGQSTVDGTIRTFIVSDANTVYIENFLYGTQLYPYIYKIITNPAYYDTDGCLHIQPYVAKDQVPHGCGRCPVNLCKGLVLDGLQLSKQIPNRTSVSTYNESQQAEEFRNEIKAFDDRKNNGTMVTGSNTNTSLSVATVSSVGTAETITFRTNETIGISSTAAATVSSTSSSSSSYSLLPRIVYIGDGSGDLCPCMRLNEHDIILAREGYPLLKNLNDPKIQPYIYAKVVPWNNGKDIHDTIMKFLRNEI